MPQVKAPRRPRQRTNDEDADQKSETETSVSSSSPAPPSSPRTETDQQAQPSSCLLLALALDVPRRRGRRSGSGGSAGRAALAASRAEAATRKRSRPAGAAAAAGVAAQAAEAFVSLATTTMTTTVLWWWCLSCLSCLAAPAAGLVIEEPFYATFEHVAAAFGPDLLTIEPPVESRPLVKARPRDGCAPLQNTMDEGAIALVERGTCNFTQKVLYAQEAGASAVVVTDTRVTDKWFMVMYGDPENTQGIDIPAVLVSHATGERLWSNRSWIPGRQGRVKASVGAAGHTVLPSRSLGALEMLGIYLLLSVLLLAFSGVCGLLFALAFTWYQRGYRTRAMRKLKSFTFRRRRKPTRAPSPSPPPPPGSALEAATTPTGTGSGTTTASGGDGNDTGQGRSTAAAGAGVGAGRGRVLSNHADADGDVQLAGNPNPSPTRRRPRACEDESCNNCGGGGHGGGRAGDGDGDEDEAGDGAGDGDGAESGGGKAAGGALNGEGSSSSSSDLMGAEDDMCAICLETYEDGDSLTGLPCRHSFHTECIQPWLSGKSALCPMCKSEAFGKGGLFLATAPRLEAAFAELAALCTENLAVLGLFFLASVACGVIAAKLSLRD